MLFLSVEPEALGHVHICHDFGTFSILISIFPHTVVRAAISPHIDSKAIFLIKFVLTLVATTVTPLVQALAVHLAIHPFAFIA
jgi:hypothetical protein